MNLLTPIRKVKKPVSYSLIFLLLFGTLWPTQSVAITGHSSMPEYGSFTAVSNADMVNTFDGSFNYQIPLLEVPNGFPITLSYSSNNVNNEALASWVGMGWDLNIGAINRIKSGVPDEYDGSQQITYFNRMEPNWTVSAGAHLGFDPLKTGNTGLTGSASVSYNNYTGLKNVLSVGFDFAGVANLSVTYSNGRFGFNPNINPAELLLTGIKKIGEKKSKTQNDDAQPPMIERSSFFKNMDKRRKGTMKITNLKSAASFGKSMGKSTGIGAAKGLFNNTFASLLNLPPSSYPGVSHQYRGYFAEITFDMGIDPTPAPFNMIETGVFGSFASQKNEESVTKSGFGYFNNETGYNSISAAMDFYVEMDKPYQEREEIIGYPLPSNDVFSYSSPVGGGSFRAYRSEFGHYRLNESKSEDFSADVGADIDLPIFAAPYPFIVLNTTSAYGGSIGGSYHYTKTDKWDDDGFTFKDDNSFSNSNEKYFFRVSGDRAGYFDLAPAQNQPIRAGFSGNSANVSSSYTGIQTLDTRSSGKLKQRSQYVDVRTNGDFGITSNGQSGSQVAYRVKQKQLNILGKSGNIIDFNSSIRPALEATSIGEVSITNKDGSTQVFGLPVHVKNERQLQYSFPAASGLSSVPNWTTSGLLMQVTANVDGSAKRKLGVVDNNLYSGSFLLTQSYDRNYIDRTGNGPSRDDFGNYTKVNYKRQFGGAGDWYGYRSPYKGVNVSYGSLSENNDDMGNFSYGEKEVYYVYSVESKTHVAFFYTSDRYDGLPAALANSPAPDDLIRGTGGTPANRLQKLDRIELYSLDDCQFISQGKDLLEPKNGTHPIKVVHFDYESYAISGELLNSDHPTSGQKGKLTLDRVWVESGGVVKSKISPYVFKYKYPANASALDFPLPYNTQTGFKEVAWYTEANLNDQDPNYHPSNTDRWGNYRNFSHVQSQLSSPVGVTGNLALFFPYVLQNPDYRHFDPAAFALKEIQLPSGGRILVQYEENDYQYVQDKRASVMVRLEGRNSWKEKDFNGKRYYLDLESLGIDYNSLTLPAQQHQLAQELFYQQQVNKERLYFNFLYALMGETPNYTKNHSDYLEGYARIHSFGYDGTGVYFTFKPSGGNPNETPISYTGQTSKREIPQKVCMDFYKNMRKMKIDGGGNVSSLAGAVDNGDEEQIGFAFLSMLKHNLKTWDRCKYFQPDMSMVRVSVPMGEYRNYTYNGSLQQSPTYYSKLGGGIRVKRLLLQDKGIGSYKQGATLLGQEYAYTTTENGQTISSGVATNEPANGRKENSLVVPIERGQQGKINALLYGRDMYSQEGPVGESLLPSPGIGYSKVTVKPIFQGETSTGWTEFEYYTAKDHPFEVKRTQLKKDLGPLGGNLPLSIGTPPISIGGVSVSASYATTSKKFSQGYLFENFEGHGTAKSVVNFTNSGTIYSKESYVYFQPDETVKIMGDDMNISTVPLYTLGREAELLAYSGKVEDYSFGGRVDVAFTPIFIVTGPFLVPFPIFVPVGWPMPVDIGLSAQISHHMLRKHAQSRIVYHPKILKKIVSETEGRTMVTEHLVFDNYTGDPVVTRSSEEYDQNSLISQSYMGAWKYDNLKPDYINENLRVLPSAGATIQAGIASSGRTYVEFIMPSQQVACEELGRFVRGDFIQLNGNKNHDLYHVTQIDPTHNRLYIERSMYNPNASAGSSISSIDILESGYTNLLSEEIGKTVYLTESTGSNFYSYTTNYDQTHPFVVDLKNMVGTKGVQVSNLPPPLPPVPSSNLITLPGPYTGMDVSHFAGWGANLNINADFSSASIANVMIYHRITPNSSGNDRVHVAIAGFEIKDINGDWQKVHCQEVAW